MISPQDIAASPAWLPLEAAGAGMVRLVRLDEGAYRAASFLDQRLLKTSIGHTLCPIALVSQAADALAPGAHYVFHIGHVGSTLLSRLIGEHPNLFSLREPAPLRALVPGQPPGGWALELRATLGLLARTWRPGQRAVVKATSFASELAVPILEADADARAVLVFSSPANYLRCILGGANSRVESRSLGASRLARLRRRLGAELEVAAPHSEGQWIAMSWLTEMMALTAVARRFSARVQWVEFDAFLTSPVEELARLLHALGTAMGTNEVERLVSGPLMRRYSKAPEYEYDTRLRRAVLACAEAEHGEEIRRGMAWLAALSQSPLAAEALERR